MPAWLVASTEARLLWAAACCSHSGRAAVCPCSRGSSFLRGQKSVAEPLMMEPKRPLGSDIAISPFPQTP